MIKEDNTEMKIRKGQAFNLAVQTAIADGKHHDTEYVTRLFLKYVQFAGILQKSSVPELQEAMNSKEVIQLFNDLDTGLSDTLNKLKGVK